MQPSPDSPAPLNVTVPFDSELGLQFTELGPDGARAQLDVRPKLLQLTGVVHGGVYCAMIESIASMAAFAWLNSHGEGGSVVGVNNNTDFLRSISSGMVYGTAEPLHRVGGNSCGWSPSPTTPTGWSPAAKCGCRTSRRGLNPLETVEPAAAWQDRRACA